MGWFGADKSISAAGEAIEKTGNVFDKLFTSDDERLTRQEAIARVMQKPDEFQHALNLADANSLSLFRAGWRPGLGWVCVASAAVYFVPQYIIASYVWISACLEMLEHVGPEGVTQLPPYPAGDSGLWQLITMLLGMGTIRQVDKFMETQS